MDGNEINYNDVFGTSEGEGDTAGAGAGTGDAGTVEGEKEQNVADSDVNDETGGSTDNTDGAENDGLSDGDDAVMSKEERARYAAARRDAERERDEKVAEANASAKKARDDAEKYISDTIARLGIVDPDSGTVISSREQLDAYTKKLDADAKQNFLDHSGMSETEYQDFIDRLPEVRAAKEQIKKADEARRASELEKAKAAVNEQVRAISQLNPDIKTIDDVLALPTYGQIREKVKRGYSLEDAYFLVHRDEIAQKQVASAKQSALNASSSKRHLEGTTSRGTGSVYVPNDVKAMYRELNPGITDAEIAKHYNGYLGSKK